MALLAFVEAAQDDTLADPKCQWNEKEDALRD